MTKPVAMKWLRPLTDDGAIKVKNWAQTMNALTAHMRQKECDRDGGAARVAMAATVETKASVLDGTAGKPLEITGELVLEISHRAGRRRGKAGTTTFGPNPRHGASHGPLYVWPWANRGRTVGGWNKRSLRHARWWVWKKNAYLSPNPPPGIV